VRWRARIGIAAAAIAVGGVGLAVGLLIQDTSHPDGARALTVADSTAPMLGSTRHTARHASADPVPAPASIASGEPQAPLVPLSEAQAQADFPISLPGDLPPDYQFSGVWLTVDGSQVRLHFAGPQGDIVLIESQSDEARRKPEGLEFETTVNGSPALAVRGDVPPQDTAPVSQLIWWTGGMSFDLYGPVAYSQIERAAASVPRSEGT
jgi:hypothetical protein